MINITKDEQRTRLELIQNDEVISYLTIHNLKIYFWGKELKVGGIGGVGTKEKYRQKGYSRAVLDEAIKVMTKDKQDLAMLFGIPDYYYRWGFVSCLPQNHLSLPTYQAERAPLYHKVRPLEQEDFSSLVAIYNQNNLQRTGAVVRDSNRFTRIRLGSHFGQQAEGFVLEKDGIMEGYLVLDKTKRSVNIAEIGGINPSVYYSIIAFVAELAIQRRVSTITANIPQDHPFSLFARDYGLTITVNYVYNADGMGRIINQDNLLQVLASDIFKNSGLNESKDSLVFHTDISKTKLGNGSNVYHIETDQATLTQLLFGYKPVAQAVFENKLKTQLSLQILQKMFPPRIGHLWGPDKF